MSTQAIVQNIINTRYTDLPGEVVEKTKKSILDTLGVMLPPTTLETNCFSLYQLMKEAGGKKESTFVGFGGKGPCWMAAFVNGSLAHALDYDDSVDEGPKPLHHPTAATLPAALAVAERKGRVSGEDFITAIALGNDLGVRLAACVRGNIMQDFPFFPLSITGVFTAAVAAGKIMGLSQNELLNALGLASHRVGGIKEIVASPDSDLRAIRDGFSNREGVLAALMASKGILAGKNAIEAMLRTYYRGDYDPEVLIMDLGKRFRGSEASYKRWPACGQTHAHIQTILQIREQNHLKPDQIEEVRLTGSKAGESLCLPMDSKQQPATSITAKISLPFVAGIALAKGKVSIEHFLPENLKDPDVLRIAKLVKYTVDPTFGSLLPVQAEIKTSDGHCYSHRLESMQAQKESSSRTDVLKAKFEDCSKYSRKHLSRARVQKLENAILQLENIDDIRQISQLLV
jgi:2-methylcitrate dehydratase PrpD